ncbi:MAG: caspase family protein [Bacteroidota bacterium]
MPKGFALHIGLNYISVKHHKWDGRLGSCVNDALAMQQIATQEGFEPVALLANEEANINAVIAQFEYLSKVAQAGDLVMITYSGHGGQVLDLNGDEDDGKDETWVLYDKELIDDKICYLLQEFREDVRILIISDSCHSGSVTRSGGKATARTTVGQLQNEVSKVKASVCLLAACQEYEKASAGTHLSKYTEALVKIWDSGKFRGTYADLSEAILRTQPLSRNPVHQIMGKSTEWLKSGRPFVI